MSVLHHVFFLNFWLAVFNSLPIRYLDGGYIVPALVRGRTSYTSRRPSRPPSPPSS
jgi:Zn-dependent protease